MKEIEDLVGRATALDEIGDKEAALNELNEAFDILIKQASDFALSKMNLDRESVLEENKSELIGLSNDFLSKDLSAAMILNSMGILFLEIDEYDAAYQKFEDSISLIPSGDTYPDPFENKKIAIQKIQSLNQEISESRDSNLD